MWFITVFQKIEPDDPNNYVAIDFGDQRTWGYYHDKEMAVNALHKNLTDMWECLYEYAVIEFIEEGVAPYAEERQWFKWDDERHGYFEIEEPKYVMSLCNFAIG